MIIFWIFISNFLYILELKEVSAKCSSPLPQGVRPACQGAKLTNINTTEDCQSFNSFCCWNDTVGSQFSKCYYVPDKQVYNVALGKPTQQSSTYKKSLLAVDGCTTCCSQTHDHTTDNSWWSVDLLIPMPIVSITIVARDYTDLQIRASNFTDDPQTLTEFVTCASNPQIVKQGETKRIPCAQNIIARVLIIMKRKTTSLTSLSLCEVQVETAGRFNAAFGKETWQSSVLDYEGFDNRGLKNVDGSLNNDYFEGSCSHTKCYADYDPWWSVDLGKLMTVYSVTIVNRGDADRRLTNLTIMVSSTSHEPSTDVCAEYPGKVSMGAAQNIMCYNSMNARYIIVRKNGDHELVMCEVIVEAACVDGKYGANCWNNCHCKEYATCDKVTGYCPGGLCAKGYKGQKCDTGCNGTFGFDCTNPCHCKDMSCNPESGSCPDKICDFGFKGLSCSTACDEGNYGANCLNNCHYCRDNVTCDKVTGHCPNGLCAKGYMGRKCDTECPARKYGIGCLHDCPTKCANNAVCDHETGDCPGGLCDDGYMGAKCNKACNDANCKVCSSISVCTRCKDGYLIQNDACEECPGGKYGLNCLQNCTRFCRNKAVCNAVNGYCPQGQCAAGYWGQKCDQSCTSGKYGPECEQSCHPHCTGPCDITNGACLVGCEVDWTGEKCEIEVQTSGQSSTVVIAVSASVTCLVVVILVLAAGYFMLRLWRRSEQPKKRGDNSISDREYDNVTGLHLDNKNSAEYYNVATDVNETNIDSNHYEIPNNFSREGPSQPYEQIKI